MLTGSLDSGKQSKCHISIGVPHLSIAELAGQFESLGNLYKDIQSFVFMIKKYQHHQHINWNRLTLNTGFLCLPTSEKVTLETIILLYFYWQLYLKITTINQV